MHLSEERVRTLTDLGLSDYQARAYLTLLEYASCTVTELSKVSRIPRNRLYEVLTDLQAESLVHVHLESPRRYRANPLTEFLNRRVGQLDERKTQLEDLAERAGDEFQPPALDQTDDLTVGQTRVLVGRRAVARELERIFATARRRITIATSSQGARRMLRYVRTGVARREGHPVDVHVLLPHDADLDDDTLAEAKDLVKHVERLSTSLRKSGVIVDDQELLLVQAIPEDDHLRLGEDFAILTTNPALLHDYQALLRAASS